MPQRFRRVALILLTAIAVSPAAYAQTAPPPKTARPPAKAAPPQKKAPAPAPAAVAPPPPPTDVRYKTKYTTGDEVTESATFITDQRERYELGDIVLLKQRDQKRNIQISKSANTYVIVADDAPVATPAAPRPAGVVAVSTSIVDMGDRKDVFGQTARHVRTVIQRQPEAGACDQSKFLTEVDGWYIDMPKVMAAAPEAKVLPGASGCADEIKPTDTGDAKLLGFAISYTTTQMQMMNIGGMGNVGSMLPMMNGGRSVDRTAGAASFVMRQVLAGAAASANQGGPSFDAALENAIEDAGKDVIESIKKAATAKK